jgi:hypothetical protein
MAYPGQPQPAANDQRATWSLVTGIAGLLCCAPLGIVAIVLGNQVKRELGGAAPSTANIGVVLGWIAIVLWAVGLLVFVVAGRG